MTARRRKLLVAQAAVVLVVGMAFALLSPAANDRGGDTHEVPAVGAAKQPDARSDSGEAGSATRKNTVTNGKGSEVIKQPEGSGQKGLPGLSRGKATNVALINKPLPHTASSRGTVVEGFPLAVVPLAPDSVVGSSGVSSAASALQVSMQATTSRSPERVLAFYRSALSGSGFAESTIPAVGGSTAAAFTHHADNLVVTVSKSRPKGSTYSVYGTLHAGKPQ